MDRQIQQGDAFLITSTTLSDHLYFVVSDPNVDNNQILMVNVTTLVAWKDDTCLLRHGDHPFIRHDSVINYADARITSIENLHYLETVRQIEWRESASRELLDRIRRGFFESRFAKRGHRELLRKQSSS